jgi:hypothetical protein
MFEEHNRRKMLCIFLCWRKYNFLGRKNVVFAVAEQSSANIKNRRFFNVPQPEKFHEFFHAPNTYCSRAKKF